MNPHTRSMNRGHAWAAAFVTAVFCWTLLLSVSPGLHSRIHSDADRVEHTCAVTFVASGNYEHAGHPLLVSTTNTVVSFSKVSALNPLWIPSPFLGASIFEHAPPSHS